MSFAIFFTKFFPHPISAYSVVFAKRFEPETVPTCERAAVDGDECLKQQLGDVLVLPDAVQPAHEQAESVLLVTLVPWQTQGTRSSTNIARALFYIHDHTCT